MVSYTQTPVLFLDSPNGKIASFISEDEKNIHSDTVKSFGEEWKKFSHFSEQEIETAGRQYFDIVSDEMLNANSLVLDIGTGSGRWTKYISPKVKFVEAVDAGESVFSTQYFLKENKNVRITQASASNIPFEDNAFDFVFSLGVFHHLPDTDAAIKQAVNKLKPGGYFLIYLYYNLENRSAGYKLIFSLSSIFRKFISSLPSFIKKIFCDLIAVFIYLPFIFISRMMKLISESGWRKIPLSYYTDKSFRIIRNDSLDRFGTPLEKRFSKDEIRKMMESSGLRDIIFSEKEPFWHAVGKKAV